MGERDAFGREIGEDSLAELGWKQAPEPQRAQPGPEWMAPAPRPAPAQTTAFDAGEAWSVRGTPKPQDSEPQPPPRRPPPAAPQVQFARPPRRRRRRGFSSLIFVAVLVVIFGASFGSLLKVGGEAVDRGQKALRDAIPTPVTQTDTAGTLDGGSLLRRATLRKALAQLPDGRVTVLTLRPDGLNATLTSDGTTTLVTINADGNMTTIDAPVAIPGKSVRLDPAAPGRIVRTVTRRSGRDADAISRLVLANGQWTVQLADGRQYTANAKGTKVRRIP